MGHQISEFSKGVVHLNEWLSCVTSPYSKLVLFFFFSIPMGFELTHTNTYYAWVKFGGGKAFFWGFQCFAFSTETMLSFDNLLALTMHSFEGFNASHSSEAIVNVNVWKEFYQGLHSLILIGCEFHAHHFEELADRVSIPLLLMCPNRPCHKETLGCSITATTWSRTLDTYKGYKVSTLGYNSGPFTNFPFAITKSGVIACII